MSISEDRHRGPDQAFTSADVLGPAAHAGWEEDAQQRVGFFTDTSICIGCKACEVACKEWNGVPDDGFDMLGSSYDNTGQLSGSSWRHVAFIEQRKPLGGQSTGITIGVPATAAAPDVILPDKTSVDLGMPAFGLPSASPDASERTEFRWLMSSDVCKHCTNAACLDVCPTGSLFRTEFGTVVVQEDICNGCGYCVPACPYGVIDRRIGDKDTKNVGLAQKCTLCYDRLGENQTPACAQACPTQSIQFGTLDELRERAVDRVATLHENGVPEARLYGDDPNGGTGGAGAFFLLLDEPEVYGLPPDPIVTTADLPRMWKHAGLAAVGFLVAAVSVFAGRRS
jgi:formate dehydrogenase iron-sulfur subunit